MDRKQKANLLRSRALMGNQNARKKAATVPGDCRICDCAHKYHCAFA